MPGSELSIEGFDDDGRKEGLQLGGGLGLEALEGVHFGKKALGAFLLLHAGHWKLDLQKLLQARPFTAGANTPAGVPELAANPLRANNRRQVIEPARCFANKAFSDRDNAAIRDRALFANLLVIPSRRKQFRQDPFAASVSLGGHE